MKKAYGIVTLYPLAGGATGGRPVYESLSPLPASASSGDSMGKPVLIDFYADWCGPCRLQTPIIEEIARRMGDQVEVKKINVDDHMDLANKYRIYVVPTLIIEKDQREVRRVEGLTDASSLEAMIRPLVEKP